MLVTLFFYLMLVVSAVFGLGSAILQIANLNTEKTLKEIGGG